MGTSGTAGVRVVGTGVVVVGMNGVGLVGGCGRRGVSGVGTSDDEAEMCIAGGAGVLLVEPCDSAVPS